MPDPPSPAWYVLSLGNALWGPLAGIALLLLLASIFRLRFLRPIEEAWATFADRTSRFASIICFAAGFVVAMGIALCIRRPIAQVHDEASYLLAADTFAHGRWTNPALPADIRAHFEALHIIVAPSYMSKYPPGQGLLLSLGERLGDPIYSLWLGAGLAAAACCWMLNAYVPRRLAYLGGLLCALHPLVLKWSQSFWGGDIALIGGFLLLGAVGRARPPQPPNNGGSAGVTEPVSDSIRELPPLLGGWGGLALALLANSRPYEGFCIAALVAIPVLPLVARGLRQNPSVWLRHVIAPFAAVLAVVAGLMLTYNARVTGDPRTMPYVIHEKLYGVAPLFLFQPLKPVPVTLRHDSMRVINARATVRDYQMQRAAPLRAVMTKSAVLARAAFQQFDLTSYWLEAPHPVAWWQRVLHYFLYLPVFGAFVAARRRSSGATRPALIGLPVFAACVCLETFINPHYGAPAGGLVALVLVDGLRHLRAVRWRRFTGANGCKRQGLALARWVMVLYLASFVYHLTEFKTPRWQALIEDRRPVIKFLERFPGKKLLFVDYGNKPLPLSRNQEWVYNSSELESQPILWARYLTPAENAHLQSRFAERIPWVLDASDPDRIRLYRYRDFVLKDP